MTAIDILLIIISGLSAIILLAILIKSLCLIIADTTNERRTKKMKKKKKKQNEELEQIKDKLEYLELKQSGAKIEKKDTDNFFLRLYHVKYVIDETVKEVPLSWATTPLLKHETDKYIILAYSYLFPYGYHILDKTTGEICDIDQLLSQKTEIEEKIKILNSIEEKNKTDIIKQTTIKPKRKVGRPKTKK